MRVSQVGSLVPEHIQCLVIYFVNQMPNPYCYCIFAYIFTHVLVPSLPEEIQTDP